MRSFLFILFVFSSGFIFAQIPSALKQFVPKNYEFKDASGPGMKAATGDILLVLHDKEEPDLDELIILRKSNNKIEKFIKNMDLMLSTQLLGTSGSSYASLKDNTIILYTRIGSNSSQSITEIYFKKAADGNYYFDSYQSTSYEYGVENLFKRVGFNHKQTGKIKFDEATDNLLFKKIKIDLPVEEFPSLDAYKKYLPKSYQIVVFAKGNLNLDAYKNDVLLIVKNYNHPELVKLLVLLQQKDGGYKVTAKNEALFTFKNEVPDPNFLNIGGLNFNNIKIKIKNGFFTIERRIGDYSNQDYVRSEEDFQQIYCDHFFHQYYTFKYDVSNKDWFTYRYGVESYAGYNPNPVKKANQYTEKQIGKIAWNKVSNFPDYCFYAPKSSAIYGKIIEKMQFEAPDYGEHPKTDKKVFFLVLQTEVPIQTYPLGKQNKETGDRVLKNLKEFQIYTTDKHLDLKQFKNQKVWLQGVFQKGSSGHHHTPILMEVKQVL